MADDVPADAAPLKLAKPPSPQRTNSNDHTIEDAMAHSGSVKRVRSIDAEDQDLTTNSSPKRTKLNDDDDQSLTNCKEPNVNNKDNAQEDKNGTKEEHLNGAVNDDEGDSIGGSGDATSQDTHSENNAKDTEIGSNKSPQNGAPSEPSTAESVDSAQGPSSMKSTTLTESNSSSDNDRTGSKTGDDDKLCDSNAKENDKDSPDNNGEEKMEVDEKDIEVKGDTKDSEVKGDTKDSEVKGDTKDSEVKGDEKDNEVKGDEKDIKVKGDEKNSEVKKDTDDKKVTDDKDNEKDSEVKKETEVIKDDEKDSEVKMDTEYKDDSAKNKENGDAVLDGDSSKDEGDKEKMEQEGKKDDIIELSDDTSKDQTDPDKCDDDNSKSGTATPIPEPTDPLAHLTDEQVQARDKIMKSLNEELRNEEAKLLLLKKLRQSQVQPVTQEPKEDTSDQAKILAHNAAQPPPLVHGPGSLKPQMGNQVNQQQRLQMPQLIRGNNMQQNMHGNIQSGPPPLVLARGGVNNLSSLHAQQQQMNRNQMMRMMTTGHLTNTTNTQSATHRVSVNETQSAASRQAAAKLALRKQLEKTLLQIPPPKPPPPELHFLPSAANNEFIILVGLEEVVNVILEYENKDYKNKKDSKYLAPYRCAQCKTDFTTIWKQGSKQGIMCENCIVSNQKKALKAEHTNRLKTAFVKALQQEQEIEQRMQQSHSASSSAAASLNIPKVKSVRQVPLAHSSHQSLQSGHHGIQVIQQPRQRVLNPAPQQRTMQPVTYAYIPQAAGINIAGIQMIPKQQFVGGVPGMVTASDRQREYLLDMISSKSNSGSTVSWRR